MKKRVDLIIFKGAPASGKSTISQMLFEHFNSVIIDFGWLREFHLNREWKRANKKEKEMAFENLIFIINNYLKNRYHHIIVNDIGDTHADYLSKHFRKYNVKTIRLIVSNDVLAQRIKHLLRDSGFKNLEAAQKYNNKLVKQKPQKNEIIVDSSNHTPQETYKAILERIEKEDM